ncbi:Na+/H+ antiporter subunit E [Colwellia sp. MB3u-70]|uniref:Na+/H+ antiporter subunit E n=1 Tax=unclassified Colwellia TaxID=196834 RepID=UPI0015F518B4|nr:MULTISPECIES: Na+/H+ antiporter subunit E [unclassified Colwellia]MBA6292729.1 Na+/H+ antiporter subunit E [Colwellia sp. MB3u-8]MBA6308799.1 Na+/H+ antiporter subunit E [Colwellia sp. MB3u-70]
MKIIKQNNELSSSPSAFSFRSVLSWRFLIRFALFSLFWGLLTRWQQNSLGLGIVFIAMASVLSLYLAPQQKKRHQWLKKPFNILSFLYYFYVQSLRGGWSIAKLALSPKLKLSPGFIKYHTDLANDSQVFTFMQVLSLLPGTVSARQNAQELTIHVLDMNTFNQAEIDDCQIRIKQLLDTSGQSLIDGEK